MHKLAVPTTALVVAPQASTNMNVLFLWIIQNQVNNIYVCDVFLSTLCLRNWNLYQDTAIGTYTRIQQLEPIPGYNYVVHCCTSAGKAIHVVAERGHWSPIHCCLLLSLSYLRNCMASCSVPVCRNRSVFHAHVI